MSLYEQLLKDNERNQGREMSPEEKRMLQEMAKDGQLKTQYDERGNKIAAQGHAAGAKVQNEMGTGRGFLAKFKSFGGGTGDELKRQGSDSDPNPDLQKEVEADQKKQRAVRVLGETSKKMHVKPDADGIKALSHGIKNGWPMNPNSLIAQRRTELRSQIDSVIQEFKLDSSQELSEQYTIKRVKSAADEKYGRAGTLTKVKKELDPKAQALRDAKLALFKDRIAGYRSQILELDNTENKLTVAKGLTDDRDYQDTIKALLTGQPIPTTLDREKSEADIDIRRDQAAKEGALTQKDIIAAMQNDQDLDIKKFRAETDRGNLSLNIERAIAEAKKGDKDDPLTRKLVLQGQALKTTFDDFVGAAKDFDPSNFTYGKKLWAGLGATMSKLGFDIGESWAKDVKQIQASTTMLGSMFANYMKMLSGAAVSENEKKRLAELYVNPDMSAEQAEQSIRTLLEKTVRDQIALSDLIKNRGDLQDAELVKAARSSISANDPRVKAQIAKLEPEIFKALKGMKAKSGKKSTAKFTSAAQSSANKKTSPSNAGNRATIEASNGKKYTLKQLYEMKEKSKKADKGKYLTLSDGNKVSF